MLQLQRFSRASSMSSTPGIVVSPEPFAAGSDAVVYNCKLMPPSQARSSSEQVAVESDDACINAVVKINRPRVTNETLMFTSPLLLQHEGPCTRGRAKSACTFEAVVDIQQRSTTEICILEAMESLQGLYVPRLLFTLTPWTTPVSHGHKLVLEYGGLTLKALAKENPNLYLEWQNEIRTEAWKALYSCHALDFTHRGIHNANILVHWSAYSTVRGTQGHPSSGREKVTAGDVEKLNDASNGDAKSSYAVHVWLIDWSKGVDERERDLQERKTSKDVDKSQLTLALNHTSAKAASRVKTVVTAKK